MKYYTETHEWIDVEGSEGRIGLSAHAAAELGDITFIELPDVGAVLQGGDILGQVESVKTANDIYAPAGCRVTEVNAAIEDAPELVNESPEENGWICKVADVNEGDLSALRTEKKYEQFLSRNEH
ncbi:MAG: glycine cleavage system H protein [Rhodothermales bacterium]|jgi:glycine cleavage system H protein